MNFDTQTNIYIVQIFWCSPENGPDHVIDIDRNADDST